MSICITKDYDGIPDWNIPGLFIHDDTWLLFLKLISDKDIEIPFQYIYGTPYDTITGGGRNRTVFYNSQGLTEEQIIQQYNNFGIGCRLALSNHLLQKKDYEDDLRLNNILAYLNSSSMNNGVILCDDEFNDYIKNNYKNLQRICSIIRPAIEVGWGNENVEYYNNLCQKYDIVVLNCGFAKNINNIKQLKYKDKIEILVNTRCTLNCKLSKRHYDLVAAGYKNKNNNEILLNIEAEEQKLFNDCINIKQQNYFGSAMFSTKEIQVLLDNKIRHFKLEGRNWPMEIIIRDMEYYISNDLTLIKLFTNSLGALI